MLTPTDDDRRHRVGLGAGPTEHHEFVGRSPVVAEKFDTFVVRGANDPLERRLHPRTAGRAGREPLYQGLAVVQDGRAVVIDTEPLSGALTWSTVLSLTLAFDELVPILTAALEA